MSERLRVLVADDELLARKRLLRLLAALPEVEVLGECADGGEVLDRVRQGGVEALLLDINMPNLSGLDAMQLLPQPAPYVIFCTAHADQAVRAFDLGAVDYLLKPVEAARLQKALERARGRAAPHGGASQPPAPPPGAGPARLPVPTRQGIVLVDPAAVTHASIEGELVTLHTLTGDLLTDFTLRELEEKLPPGKFVRVHRRALLNLEQVVRLEPLETGGYIARTVKGAGVEVSRQAARDLRKKLGLRKGPGEED